MMMFDEESGDGGADTEQTTQTPKEIMGELNELMKDDSGGSETPKTVDVEKIKLELEDDTGLEEASEASETTDKKDEDKKDLTAGEIVEKEKIEAKEKEEEDKKPTAEDEMRKDFLDFAQTQLKAAGISPEQALTGEEGEKGVKVEKVIEKVEEPTPTKVPTVKPLELSDELWEKVRDDKEAFVELINNIQKSIASAVKEEVLLESIPTVQGYARNYITSVNQVEVFYRDNPELNPYRPIVGFIAAKLGQSKPDLNKDDIMKETGKEAYRLLKLTKGTNPPDNGAPSRKTPPPFAESGTRKGKPGEKVYKNSMQKELAEMNTADR